jgi:hypothetical protein
MYNFLISMLIAAIITTSSAACALPCDGVDRSISKEYVDILATAIAKQLKVASVEVLQLFKIDSWSIVYVDTHESDEAFLFYENDPLTSRYVILWSGAAACNEERQIKDWVIKNAPGIPEKLADCFAWYISKERNL